MWPLLTKWEIAAEHCDAGFRKRFSERDEQRCSTIGPCPVRQDNAIAGWVLRNVEETPNKHFADWSDHAESLPRFQNRS